MSSKKVAVIGGGFSGLTLAWALQKKGVHVEVFEARARAGGMIETTYGKVPVEAAAHALLASREVEELAQDLGIQLVTAGFVSKNKWIFRDGQPRRWPLSLGETIKSLGFPKKPLEGQTVREWAIKHFSESLNDFLLAPALQGIYAAQSDKLSARLIFGGIYKTRIKPGKGRLSGSVAPLNGMEELTSKLSEKLKIHFNSQETVETLLSRFDQVVVAANLAHAADLLSHANPSMAEAFRSLPRASLLSATISYNETTSRVRGFGCLFPKKEGFESSGVLFNSDLFAKRGKNSETWILGGDFSQVSSQIILQKILKDRARLDATPIHVDFCEMHRWPQTLPLYGLELEKTLARFFAEQDIFLNGARAADRVWLTGNYLGGIGLAKILTYNNQLSVKILESLS